MMFELLLNLVDPFLDRENAPSGNRSFEGYDSLFSICVIDNVIVNEE
jgi:hypothetical protein